jgi:hypothetical protein
MLATEEEEGLPESLDGLDLEPPPEFGEEKQQ